MTLSRWRRVMTGFAAGVIVLCAALLGGSLRDDGREVAVVTNERPENVIPIPDDSEDTGDPDGAGGDGEGGADSTADPADAEDPEESEPGEPSEPSERAESDPAIGPEEEESESAAEPEDEETAEPSGGPESGATGESEGQESESGSTAGADGKPGEGAEPASTVGADGEPGEGAESDPAADPSGEPEPESGEATSEPAPEGTAAPEEEAAEELGLGGGLDGAECSLDRLVVYAGNLASDSASRIRDALVAAGFGTECNPPVEVLASNCPLQFDGVLASDTGYDPMRSYVAAGAGVNRATMTVVMGAVGYTGNAIDILDFGFGTEGQSGENWMAVFVPPSLQDWGPLAEYAGLSPTIESYCLPSGELAG